MLPLLVSASHAARLEPPLREKALAASIAVATLTSTPAVADAAPREGGGAGGGGGGGGGEAGGTGGGALLREAAEEMVSEHVPLRTKGLVTIRNLLHRREGCVMSQLDLIVIQPLGALDTKTWGSSPSAVADSVCGTQACQRRKGLA